MKKKWIILGLIVVAIMIIFIGCKKRESTKEEIYLEFQKMISSIDSYECSADVEIFGNKTSHKYTFKHTYNKPSNYKVEVVSPEHLKGKTIEYKDDKVIVNNSNIEDKIELPNIGDNDQYMFIGEFIKNYLQSESVDIKILKDYLVLELSIPGENEYFNKQILYVKADTKYPDKMEIIDKEGNVRFRVIYSSFEYKK